MTLIESLINVRIGRVIEKCNYDNANKSYSTNISLHLERAECRTLCLNSWQSKGSLKLTKERSHSSPLTIVDVGQNTKKQSCGRTVAGHESFSFLQIDFV